MSKIIALVEFATPASVEIINKVVKALFNVTPTILDSNDAGGWNDDPDLILTFGQKAYEATVGISRPFIALPEPSRLLDTEENQEARQYTWEKLKEAKVLLDSKAKSGQVISPQEMLPPKLTRQDIAELEKSNPNDWVGRTKNGKSIRLSARHTDEGSEDIKLTFAELYAIKVAMELLEVTEFHLVPSTQSNTRSRS